jgi:rRNA maturation protein Rpf1
MSSKKNVLLTTSREPTDKIRTFCNDIAHSIPNVIRVNRGKLSLDGAAEKALELHADRMIIIDRWKEGFANIRFFRIGNSGLTPFPPQINIASVRLRREFEAKIKPIKSLAMTVAFENSSVSKRLAQSIGNFFNLPVFAGRGIVSNFSAAMRISSEASDRFQITFILLPTLIEVGPRINVSKVVWDDSK